MDRPSPGLLVASAVLVFCMLAASGCATVGLDSKPSPAATKVTPQPQVTSANSGISAPQTLRTVAPVTTPATPPAIPPPVTTPLQDSRYSVKTCAGLGGFVASPGERCSGTWLDATETFSCCSVLPVPDTMANLSVSARSLDLRVNLADDPGSILP